MLHLISTVAEETVNDIPEGVAAGMTDMHQVVNGKTTAIHSYNAWFDGGEDLLLLG
jgi:hypothetical protein